ncbi:hypothetical protein CLV69_11718 [Amycolatopsis arida]|nr:hypothetical protein CLV69_11718 [Amycolatopsis arida]
MVGDRVHERVSWGLAERELGGTWHWTDDSPPPADLRAGTARKGAEQRWVVTSRVTVLVMTQPPPSGHDRAPRGVPSWRIRPRLRKVTLAIEDASGRTWTSASDLVPDPRPRSVAAKTLGWVVTLAVLVGVAFAAAWILGWLVEIVHQWWPVVPSMPYAVAVKIVFVGLLGTAIGTVGKVIVSYALGSQRLPEDD